MLSTSFLQLETALHEWRKDCPSDSAKDIKEFCTTPEFFDRPSVFFKGEFQWPTVAMPWPSSLSYFPLLRYFSRHFFSIDILFWIISRV